MKILIILSLIVIHSLFISCSNEKNQISEELKNVNITLIFQDVPAKWRVARKAGGYTPAQCEVTFIDDNFIPQIFIPDPKVDSDTLTISTTRNHVEFRHTYKGLDKLSYLFKPGDTVLFTYKNKEPFATLLNRDVESHDLNVDLLTREILYPNDYPSLVKYKNSFFFMDRSDDMLNSIEKAIASANDSFSDEKINEKLIIDSLYQHGLLSKDRYDHISTRIVYDKKLMELFNINGGPFRSKNPIPNLSKENFIISKEIDMEMQGTFVHNILDSNDSLLYYGYHQDILDWVNIYYFSRKVGHITSTNYIGGIATAGSNIPDYLALYDTIHNSHIINKQSATALKFKTIEKIIENFSIDAVKHALEKFKKDVDDTLLVNYINRKYSLPTDTSSYTYALQLVSIDSERLSYDDLIEKHKGKLIYVDFWSSTCRPCIEQFKFSRKLVEKYTDEELVQIYISIEPNLDSWQEACKKYGLTNESYLAKNLFSSLQLEDMNIKYVPHYYLYDTRGELVEDFAPRPNDEKLITLINAYL